MDFYLLSFASCAAGWALLGTDGLATSPRRAWAVLLVRGVLIAGVVSSITVVGRSADSVVSATICVAAMFCVGLTALAVQTRTEARVAGLSTELILLVGSLVGAAAFMAS